MTRDVDLLLVNPGNRLEQFAGLNELATVAQPLGLAMIAAYVRQFGYSVAIIDAEAEFWTPEETIKEIEQYNPLIVGLSAFTTKMTAAGRILRLVKERMPDVWTVIGGHHASAIPVRTLKEETVDFVVKGEGFRPVVGLLHKMGESDDTNIQGIWYRNGNVVVGNGRAEGMKALDALPFAAWDLLPMNKYRAHHWQAWGHDVNDLSGFAVIYTSLGCPFNCVAKGTEITTNHYNHSRKIEHIAQNTGEEVFGWHNGDIGKSLVLKGQDKIVNELIEITLSDGRVLAVTPEHLIYTKRGWIKAEFLLNTDEVLTITTPKGKKNRFKKCPICGEMAMMSDKQRYCSIHCQAIRPKKYMKGEKNCSKRRDVKEKIRLTKIGERNPMKRKEVVAKMLVTQAEKGQHIAFGDRIRKLHYEGEIRPPVLTVEQRRRNSDRMKKNNPMFDPDVAKRAGKTHSFRFHNDSEYRDRQLKSRKRHPNKAEQRLIKINKWHNLPFKFVGDGSYWVGPCKSGMCRNPDFLYINGNKKILLLHGRYFHQVDLINEIELADYKDKGYEVLVIWDDELKRDNRKVLANKIRRFCSGEMAESSTS